MEMINACVLEVRCNHLLVLNCDTGQKVRVNTPCARRFCVGERICVTFRGTMTMSIPPQIRATCITRNRSCC